jgi:hypothetical protein
MSSDVLKLITMEHTENGDGRTDVHLVSYVSGTGNIAQVPPLYKEYLFGDIFANPIATAILNNILGPRPELRYLNSNTVLPLRQNYLQCRLLGESIVKMSIPTYSITI